MSPSAGSTRHKDLVLLWRTQHIQKRRNIQTGREYLDSRKVVSTSRHVLSFMEPTNVLSNHDQTTAKAARCVQQTRELNHNPNPNIVTTRPLKELGLVWTQLHPVGGGWRMVHHVDSLPAAPAFLALSRPRPFSCSIASSCRCYDQRHLDAHPSCAQMLTVNWYKIYSLNYQNPLGQKGL